MVLKLPELHEWLISRFGIFSTISDSQIEFLLLRSLPEQNSGLFCKFFQDFFPVDPEIREIIEHLDSRNFIDILRRKTEVMKKIKLVFLLKKCDFFKFQSEKAQDKEQEQKEGPAKESGREPEPVPTEQAQPASAEPVANSSIESVLKILNKKRNNLKSENNSKVSRFIVKDLLSNPEDHSSKKAGFHYKIKNLTRFFHPKKSFIKKSFRKISRKIEKELRYNGIPNIYSEMIGSMQELIQSFPPKIEFIEKTIAKSIFEGVQPENEKLPANEETILPFADLEEVAKVLNEPNENPYYEILPLSIDPF